MDLSTFGSLGEPWPTTARADLHRQVPAMSLLRHGLQASPALAASLPVYSLIFPKGCWPAF